MTYKQICLIHWSVSFVMTALKASITNIAKGTTDPRVEFITQNLD